MQRLNKPLSVFMSFLLSFMLVGVPAYADETLSDNAAQSFQRGGADDGVEEPAQENGFESSDESQAPIEPDVEDPGQSSDGQIGDVEETEQNGSPGTESFGPGEDGRQDAEQSSDVPANDASESKPDKSSDAAVDSEDQESDKDADAIKVAASEAVGFVYVDEPIVAIGQEQNIAIGLIDEEASIEGARLDLASLADGETIEVEASAVAGDTALFTTTFELQESASAYQLVGVRYEVGDVAFYADLTQTGEETSYVFDVVTQSVADAMKDSNELSEGGEVSAFVIEDSGELVAKESVEAAIETADEKGVRNLEEGESVIDQEMLEAEIAGEEEAQKELEDTDASNDPLGDFFAGAFGVESAWAAASKAREGYLIVALDPGHGGSDGGASHKDKKGNADLLEKDVNLSIAQYCYNELSAYSGVTPFLTRTDDYAVSLQSRVNYAVSIGADVFVSIHCNSGGGAGAEVWVPNSSSYNYGAHVEGKDLGEKILSKLTALGLKDRDVKVRNSERVDGEGPFYYPDGSIQDYYTVIEASREKGIPGIIVEHAFIDNDAEASKLRSDSFRQKLGRADAEGVAKKYNLLKDSIAQEKSSVRVRAHVGQLGEESAVYDQKVAGTVGKGLGLEAFQASLQNSASAAGGITYRSYVGSSWQGWASNGAWSGTRGRSTALQAVQIKLTGSAANRYDVYYRVHVSNIGWLGWAKNGQSAGSTGYDYNAEAIQITVVPKGSAAPGNTATPFKTRTVSASISYQAHVANIGWQNSVTSGAVSGTTGKSLSIEALRMKLVNAQKSGSVEYNVHCAYIGWQGFKSDGAVGGTTGQSRQTEAIQIRLTGDMAQNYDVYYRVHSANFGWLDWAKNGEKAGSEGYGFAMQAMQVQLVKKGGAAPGTTENPYYKRKIGYTAHVSNIGWQSNVYDGSVSGTTGKSLSVEALQMSLINPEYSGGISYRAHCANIGWQGWRNDGATAGTTGQSRQTEAMQVKLYGEMANRYDVYYRVHSKNFGWLGWAKNGEEAGTSGYGYRMEAYQIQLVPKGGSAPGSTSNAYRTKSSSSVVNSASSIMGSSKATAAQMVTRFKAAKRTYPSSVYSSKGAGTIEKFCQLVVEEANAEGVRAEVLFCQAMKETGWLQFGGSVKAAQCNFGGLGATSSTVGGATFSDVRTGLRAQAQHLKAYASTAPLNNACVDPRFALVTRGIAPNLENLNGRWAVPGATYGQDILKMINELLKY